jgi:hypothetical protein
MKKNVMLSLLVLLAIGCAHHELEFVSFGKTKPAFERQVVEGYSAIEKNKAPGPSSQEVSVYMKTLPPDVSVEGGTVSIAKGSPRIALGAFEWRGKGLLPNREMAGPELAKIAKSAGGNELVILDADIYGGYLSSARGIVLLNKKGPSTTKPKG